MRYSPRRKSGLARARQVAKLRREAEVRRITIGGKPYEVPVVTCPEPMDCTPLGSSRKPPAVLQGRRVRRRGLRERAQRWLARL